MSWRSVVVTMLALLLPQLLSAQTQAPPTSQAKAALPGQIAGHVYRVDKGTPLSGVIVTVTSAGVSPQRSESQRSAADGSYQFAAVVPGLYQIASYRTGFITQFYGDDKPQNRNNCVPACISLGSGQKLTAIDLRLTADPLITTMTDDMLPASFPGAQARFSPDGKFLALMIPVEGAWLYDMSSRQMASVIKIPPYQDEPEFQIRDIAWSADGTLYVDTKKIRLDGRHPLVAATMAGTKEIAEFPAPVAAIFQSQAASLPDAQPDESVERSNDQYVVSTGTPSHGAVTLTMYPKDGSAEQDIAEDGGAELQSFVLDSARSLVLYPVKAQSVPDGIGIFDLKTRQSREIALPNRAEQLLDQTSDGTGHLVAYVVRGDCEPDVSSDEAENQRAQMQSETDSDFKLRLKLKRTIPAHVCFVKLP